MMLMVFNVLTLVKFRHCPVIVSRYTESFKSTNNADAKLGVIT
jgi:hypothetical protein